MYERACVEIHTKHLINNMRRLRALVPASAQIMAVVKADGYGHDAAACARAALAGGATALGVAAADEGIALREAGMETPILVLSPLAPAELPRALHAGLAVTLPGAEHAEQAAALAQREGQPLNVHIKIDTGMHRIGFPHTDTKAILRAAALPGLRMEGMFSHFADSDNPDAAYTDLQYERFLSTLEALRKNGLEPGIRHIANSAAILRHGYELDMVRAGIVFYGISPMDEAGMPNRILRADGFLPALSVRSHVSNILSLPAGETVGYGRSYTTERPCVIAAVPIGYADGYGRALSNRGHVLIHGQAAPIRGNVCMDQLMVEVTDIPAAALGDEVVLIGKQNENEITAEQLAALQNTIPYEIITRLGKRLDRLII